MIGFINKGDTRSSDYGSYAIKWTQAVKKRPQLMLFKRMPVGLLRPSLQL